MSEETRRRIHESPPVMTVPLIVLAVFSVISGYVGLPAVLDPRADLLGRFLAPVLPTGKSLPSAAVEWALILVSTAAAVGGLFAAYLLYIRHPKIPARLAARWPRMHRLLVGKYYVDEFYDAAVVRPLVRGSELLYGQFDLKIVDGALNGTAAAADAAGRGLSRLQTGLVKDYALAFLLGAVLFLGFILAWKI